MILNLNYGYEQLVLVLYLFLWFVMSISKLLHNNHMTKKRS